MQNTDPALSIFYPAHNEAKNLPALISHANDFVQRQNFPVEVIVVNDGSLDESEKVLADLKTKYSFLKSVSHAHNKGYGEALRSGFVHSKAPLVFYTDGDFQFRLDELEKFVPLLKSEKWDALIGYRHNRQDNLIRKMNALLWGLLIRLSLGIKARDIDCAYKLFRKESLENLVFTTTGAMISTELLFHLQKNHLKFKELPVSHYPRILGQPTGANLSVIARAFRELFLFFWKNRVRS